MHGKCVASFCNTPYFVACLLSPAYYSLVAGKPLLTVSKYAIQIERQLGNIERVRTVYEKYLEWSPANCTAWCKFAEFEQQYLGEVGRARAIYELAIAQPILDMPEVLWKVRAPI